MVLQLVLVIGAFYVWCDTPPKNERVIWANPCRSGGVWRINYFEPEFDVHRIVFGPFTEHLLEVVVINIIFRRGDRWCCSELKRF